VITTLPIIVALTPRPGLGSLVYPDKLSQKGDKESESDKLSVVTEELEPDQVVLSLPAAKCSSSGLTKTSSSGKQQKKKRTKTVSRRQKLLRRRCESQRSSGAGPDEDDDAVEVRVKYSVVYFNWAVSDEEDSDDSDDEDFSSSSQSFVENVTLPMMKKLSLAPHKKS
jgi:hypothetical protein